MNIALLVLLLLGFGEGILQAEKKPADKITKVETSATDEKLKAVVREAKLRNVLINTDSKKGSGVIIQDGFVLTSFHMLEVDSEVYVNGKVATILATDPMDDLVLLRVETSPHVEPVRLAATEAEQVDQVFYVGNPSDYVGFVAFGRVTCVSAKYVLSDAVILSGASGGGLYSATTGELLGINDGIEGIVFAFHVKLCFIKKFLDANKQFLK